MSCNLDFFSLKFYSFCCLFQTFGGTGICTALQCRPSISNFNCFSNGIGAIDGTPCGSAKSCLQGQCVSDSKIPNSNCLYGDDLVSSYDILNVIILPTTGFMTCSEAISYLTSSNYDFVYFCKNHRQIH